RSQGALPHRRRLLRGVAARAEPGGPEPGAPLLRRPGGLGLLVGVRRGHVAQGGGAPDARRRGLRLRGGPVMSNIANDLEYYLGYKPDSDLIVEAEEWQQDHPGSSLAEWVDAMREIGAL